MTVLSGNKEEGWTLKVTDLEFRIIASTFRQLLIESATSPENKKADEQAKNSSMASFACSIYNEMVNARGGIEDVIIE